MSVRIAEEKALANSTKMCYTYDNLNRVTKRTIKNECDEVISEETYSHDAAGNITDAPNSCFEYDTNNCLTTFNGNNVSYDLDGNMLSNGSLSCTYDSANRLISAGGHTYTYNAEDVRIRNLCGEYNTTYTYNTNCKLSQLLCKTTNGITTKYVYGRGLIGEEKEGCFKTYHFDYRGSTVAITDMCGNITDTFAYDTYGKLISRTGSSFVIFGYNGRDGVVTDKNGLIYMRARYYSPDMRRFVNADILAGKISESASLNRYAYVNGNPVSFVDPFGLERTGAIYNELWKVLGYKYDGSGRDFRRSEQGMPPYAYEVWWQTIGKDTIDKLYKLSQIENLISVSGSTTTWNYNFISKLGWEQIIYSSNNSTGRSGWFGIGIEGSAVSSEGSIGIGDDIFSISLNGNIDLLTAGATAGLTYKDGFGVGAEAGASVISSEGTISITIFGFELEVGLEADLLSAEAEAKYGVTKNKNGTTTIGGSAGASAGLFGLGLIFNITLPF